MEAVCENFEYLKYSTIVIYSQLNKEWALSNHFL